MKRPVLLTVCGILNIVRNWARKLSIAYALFALATGIVGLFVSYAFIFKPFMAQAQGAKGPEAAALVGGAVGGMIGNCFGLIYPILLLIFMTRPSVVAACQPAPEIPPLPPPTP